MFENIGGKIKVLAKVLFAIGSIIFILIAVFSFFEGLSEGISSLVLTGLLTLILGPLAAWISTWLLYGFGVLVESNERLSDIVEDELVFAINDLSSKVEKISCNHTSSKTQNSTSKSKDSVEKFPHGFVVDTSITDTID